MLNNIIPSESNWKNIPGPVGRVLEQIIEVLKEHDF
jgi:hypothetical protein